MYRDENESSRFRRNFLSDGGQDEDDYPRQTFEVAEGLEEATTAVESAESTELQGDVDSARLLVQALEEGPEKEDLVSRLAEVEAVIKAKKEAEEAEEAKAKKLQEATNAVANAESSKRQADVNSARVLVEALGEVAEKSGLLARLSTVEGEIAKAGKLQVATNAVAKAEKSQKKEDIDSARLLLNALEAGEGKQGLISRLDLVRIKIPADKVEDTAKHRGKNKMRYGLKEVADVIFFDLKTKRPVLIFDTLKTSNIENASESTEATGGQGNSPLISWDYGRTATLTMQDALLSDKSLGALSGSEVQDASDAKVMITRHEIIEVGSEGAIELGHDAVGEIHGFMNEAGALGDDVFVTADTASTSVPGEDGEPDTAGTVLDEGTKIAVFYESTPDVGAQVVTFSSDKFPGIYRVVGTSLVRDEDGMDHPFQFIIPRAKLQSGFTFTMDPENVSAFDFNLEVLVESGTRKLYDIVRM